GSSVFMDRNADVAATSKVPVNADTQEQITEARGSALSPALAEDQFNGKVVDTNNKALRSRAVVSHVDATKAKSHVKHLKEKTANGAEPIGGWKSFERYINEQVDSLKASNTDTLYSENVELEFSIDEQGRPANIIVLQKPDSLTAAQAIQILKNGPKWKSKKKEKKVKVIILF
ncbi:MAG TPA: hypothetical protein VKA92_02305, partial [Segetibacter sp.]|nr:hypothetical protein [Segetibacter sp.]